MSSAFNRSSVIWHFDCGDVIKIHNRITWFLYGTVTHMIKHYWKHQYSWCLLLLTVNNIKWIIKDCVILSTLTWALDASVLAMLTIVHPCTTMGTLQEISLGAFTKHVIEPNCSTSLSVMSFPRVVDRRTESQHLTSNICVVYWPGIITYGTPPLPVIVHFHSSLRGWRGTSGAI